jgi:hypothetical protein
MIGIVEKGAAAGYLLFFIVAGPHKILFLNTYHRYSCKKKPTSFNKLPSPKKNI